MTDKTASTKPAAKKTVAPAKPTATKSTVVKTAKLTKTSKPAPTSLASAAPSGKKDKKIKLQKTKVIRDSFTLPQDDYAKISELKQSCLKSGLHVKKSELIRAGLRLLSKLDATQLHAELEALEKIKTGRPKAS